MDEDIVVNQLLWDADYLRDVYSFVKPEYFSGDNIKTVECVLGYFNEYGEKPSKEVLKTLLPNLKKDLRSSNEIYKESKQFLLDFTAEFVSRMAMIAGLQKSFEYLENEKNDPEGVYDIIKKSIVKLDTDNGLAYYGDLEKRLEDDDEQGEKLPIGIKTFDKITVGGFERKTINFFMGQSGIGKTLILSNIAAAYLRQGYNVAYASMEISDRKIGKRIDAIMLQMNMAEILKTDPEKIEENLLKIRNRKSNADLYMKDFENAVTKVSDIDAWIDRIEKMNDIKIDVCIFDYIGIMDTGRIKGRDINSYSKYKSISEEMRGLMQRKNMIGFSAAQVNGDGIDSDNPSMKDIAESKAIIHTADMLLAVYETEQSKHSGLYVFKQLKSRYSVKEETGEVFTMQVDKSKMTISDPPNADGLVHDAPEKQTTNFNWS